MQDLTKGSLARNLLQTTSFMLVGMIFQTLYFLVDLYFVGRLGKTAVAAVSVSGNLMFLVLALTQTLGVGYLAVGYVFLQMTLNMLFLQREYRRKLAFAPAAADAPRVAVG